MPLIRPTISEISLRIQTEISKVLGLDTPTRKQTILYALSQALAGVSHLMFGNQEWLERQVVPDKADPETVEMWCNLYGIKKRDATYASGILLFSGKPGSKVPKDTTVSRSSDGVIFVTQLEKTVPDSGTIGVPCICSVAGTVGNSPTNTAFELQNPIIGISPKGVTPDSRGLRDGYDMDSPNVMLRRLITKMRNPGRGGSFSDYELWAQEVPGVGRVWSYDKENISGEIDIYALTTDINNPITTDAMLSKIDDIISIRKPLGVKAGTQTLTAKLINIDLKLPQGSIELKDNVQNALKEYFFKETSPRSTITVANIKRVIADTAQTEFFKLNDPLADIIIGQGEMGLLGEFICA